MVLKPNTIKILKMNQPKEPKLNNRPSMEGTFSTQKQKKLPSEIMPCKIDLNIKNQTQ
jgi:hypothetical protein